MVPVKRQGPERGKRRWAGAEEDLFSRFSDGFRRYVSEPRCAERKIAKRHRSSPEEAVAEMGSTDTDGGN